MGIIGVVAALTLPTLISKHQKKVVSARLKIAYSQLYQALQTAQAEYGDYSGWSEADSGFKVNDIQDTEFVKVFVDKYIAPYLKLTEPPKRATLYDIGYKNGIYHYTPSYYHYYFAELANGRTGIMRMFIIIVDINGASGENRFGHDMFAMMFNSRQGLFTGGENKTDSFVFQKCNDGDSMFYCTELLKRSGWEITKEYPW